MSFKKSSKFRSFLQVCFISYFKAPVISFREDLINGHFLEYLFEEKQYEKLLQNLS